MDDDLDEDLDDDECGAVRGGPLNEGGGAIGSKASKPNVEADGVYFGSKSGYGMPKRAFS